MNNLKNKTMIVMIILMFAPMYAREQGESIFTGWSLFKKNSGQQAQYQKKSYFGKVLDYLQSPQGIETTIATASSAVFTVMVTYWIIHALRLNNEKLQFDMEVYFPGDIEFTFDDVAGLAGAKADMKDIIVYLQNPDKFHQIGAHIPKGVLMNGSAGNGKTLLAKAFAGEVNCPFISVCGSTFEHLYVGVGAIHVRQLFSCAADLAEKYGACIIFIDEIDALAVKRSVHGGDKDHGQTVAQLLQSMDGLQAHNNPIVVIGATNRAELIDRAVVRPGRFDRIVEVTKPSIKERVELISLILAKVSHDAMIDIERIARMTGGFSGAQLAHLMNEAAILAAIRDSDYVELEDIELAFDHITLGREIVGMEQSFQDKLKVAIHEAGHVIGWIFGDHGKYIVHKASITPRAHTLGIVYAMPLGEVYESTEDEMKAMIVVSLCGGLAEQAFGHGKSSGVASDLAKARRIAYDMVVKYGMSEQLNYLSYDEIDLYLPNDIATQVHKEVQKIIDECYGIAKELIDLHTKDIDTIAYALVRKGTILGEEMYRLINLPFPTRYI